jgi:hypothetical protein
MSTSHSEEGVRGVVIEHKLNILGFGSFPQSIGDGVGDAQPSIGSVFDIGRPRVDVG